MRKTLYRVTVIMPAYNHENFISESIESVLNQTYKDIEFLILNDGSSDATKNVIEKYAAQDSRIRFINKPNNEGTVAALNDLIEESNGEYIIWLSSDDLFFPYTVERLMERAETVPDCSLVFGGVTNIDQDGNELYTDVFGEIKDAHYFHKRLLRQNIVPGCSVAAKKDAYIAAGGFDARFRHTHDYHIWLKIFADTDVSYINEPLSKNRVHPGQISSLGGNESDAVRVCFDIYKNKALMRRYLDRIGLEYSEETLVFMLKQLASLLIKDKKSEVKREFAYQLDKFIRHYGVSESNIKILLREKAFLEFITDKSVISQVKITRDVIDGAFRTLSTRIGLDGILINPEAIRYHLLDENDAESFFKKVVPHDNVLCTAEISAKDFAHLKQNLIFYGSNDDKKDVCKIGLTSFMAENAPYRSKLRNVDTLMHVTLSGELYRIMVELGKL